MYTLLLLFRKHPVEQLDVKEIMNDISQKAKNNAMLDEEARLQSIDIRSMLQRTHVSLAGASEGRTMEQMLDEMLESASLRDQYHHVASHRGGIIGSFFSTVLSKLFSAVKVFLDPLFSRQERYNLFNAQVIKQLSDKLDEVESRVVGSYPLDFDYKGFEDKYRGPQEDIEKKQRQYLHYFKDCKNVMDIGCGRGEFLVLLSEANASGFGVERDDDMVHECRKKGLKIYQEDIIAHLRKLHGEGKRDILDGVFCAQVLEHLPMDAVIEVMELVYDLLAPGKVAIWETVNPRSLYVFTAAMYMDPTHTKPLHPFTLSFIAEKAGYSGVHVEYLSPSPDQDKMTMIPEDAEHAGVYNTNMQKLNSVLFGEQDFALVTRK